MAELLIPAKELEEWQITPLMNIYLVLCSPKVQTRCNFFFFLELLCVLGRGVCTKVSVTHLYEWIMIQKINKSYSCVLTGICIKNSLILVDCYEVI